MARLETSRGGWGAVDDPETGDLVQLGEEIPLEVAERCAKEYAKIYVADRGDEAAATADEGSQPQGESAEDDDETLTCKGKDGECSREVTKESPYCWQHSPE